MVISLTISVDNTPVIITTGISCMYILFVVYTHHRIAKVKQESVPHWCSSTQ